MSLSTPFNQRVTSPYKQRILHGHTGVQILSLSAESISC